MHPTPSNVCGRLTLSRAEPVARRLQLILTASYRDDRSPPARHDGAALV